MSDTSRYGPAWMSTWAMTVSRRTAGDDAAQAVAGRRVARPLLRIVAEGPGERGQVGALDDPVPVLAPGRGEPPGVHPAPHRVGADPEQLGRLTDPKRAHAATLALATATPPPLTPRSRTIRVSSSNDVERP